VNVNIDRQGVPGQVFLGRALVLVLVISIGSSVVFNGTPNGLVSSTL